MYFVFLYTCSISLYGKKVLKNAYSIFRVKSPLSLIFLKLELISYFVILPKYLKL